ncbi:class I SAM-dependent methyltransferase, partial [Mycobacterium alsense]
SPNRQRNHSSGPCDRRQSGNVSQVRLDTVLQGVPVYDQTSTLSAKAAGRIRRSRQIDRYFHEVSPEKRCLSIGSGPDVIDGWLCTDLIPLRRETVYLDATKRWPMPSASFRYMACEHMIEHVPYEAGLRVISEAHRVLQPGGVLRISTPDLEVIRLLPDSDDPDVHDYIRWFNRTFGSAAQRDDEANPVHALNLMMHEFGHIHLYDEGMLRQVLARAGFRQIVRCDPRMSDHAELVGVDRHADWIPDKANRVEALILEATA